MPFINGRRKERTNRDLLTINAVTPTICENPTSIEVDGTSCAVVNFCQFMAENDLGWGHTFFDQRNMPVSIRLDPCDVSLLRESIDMHDHQIADRQLSDRNTASKQDRLARERRHGQRILEMIGDDGEKFFMGSIRAVIRADNDDALDRDFRYYRSTVRAQGMNFLPIPHGQLSGLLAASPLMCPDPDGYERTVRPFPASTIGASLYGRESGLNDGVGIDLGVDQFGGEIVLDIVRRTATRQNANIAIFGGAGSGKSTLAKMLAIEEYLIWGSRVIIIDPEGEFTDLCRALGGDVITVGARSSAKISPLQPRALTFDDDPAAGSTGKLDPSSAVDDEDARLQYVLLSTIPFAKSFLHLTFDIAEDDLDYLEEALVKAYERYGITSETTFDEYFSKGLSYPIMSDLYEEINYLKFEAVDLDPTAAASYARLAMKLRSAAKGILAPLWNTRSTIHTESNFIVINTEEMSSSESQKQGQYYNILSWVWSEVRTARATGKPIRVVIDECHTIVNANSKAAADMVKSMVKRIRKYGGGTTCITQEPNDLLSPEIRAQGASICNNATYKFIGQCEGENVRSIAELYSMPEELVNRIKAAERGNFAVFAGADRTWAKVNVPDWMLAMFGSGGGM